MSGLGRDLPGVALVVCIGAAVAATLLTFQPAPVVLVDTWGYMAYGRLIVESGEVTKIDPFSYMPTIEPWVYHWLSDVCTYLIARELGGTGLLVVRAGLWLGTCIAVYAAARAQGAAWWVACAVLLSVATPTAPAYSFFRPQGITFFLFAVELWVLASAGARGSKRLAWLVPLMLVWANFHGGVTAGVGILWVYTLGRLAAAVFARAAEPVARERMIPLVGFALAATLATLLTPWGLDYWRFALRAAGTPRENIIEWGSLFTLPQKPFVTMVALAIATAAAVLATELRRDAARSGVIAVTLLAACLQIRHIPFFGIAVAAFLPGAITRALQPLAARFSGLLAPPRGLSMGARRALAAIAGTAIFLVAAREVAQPQRWKVWTFEHHVRKVRSFPYGAAEFIRLNELSGNIATPYVWGAFIIWKLYPACRVSFDSRAELYDETSASDNWAFLFGKPGWERLLDEYPTELVLVERRLPQYRLMRRRSDWRMVFEDDLSAVFVPNRPDFDRTWKMPERVRATFP